MKKPIVNTAETTADFIFSRPEWKSLTEAVVALKLQAKLVGVQLVELTGAVGALEREATISSALEEELDSIHSNVASAVTRVANLRTQLTRLQAGQPVSRMQLDALNAEAADIQTALAAATREALKDR